MHAAISIVPCLNKFTNLFSNDFFLSAYYLKSVRHYMLPSLNVP